MESSYEENTPDFKRKIMHDTDKEFLVSKIMDDLQQCSTSREKYDMCAPIYDKLEDSMIHKIDILLEIGRGFLLSDLHTSCLRMTIDNIKTKNIFYVASVLQTSRADLDKIHKQLVKTCFPHSKGPCYFWYPKDVPANHQSEAKVRTHICNDIDKYLIKKQELWGFKENHHELYQFLVNQAVKICLHEDHWVREWMDTVNQYKHATYLKEDQYEYYYLMAHKAVEYTELVIQKYKQHIASFKPSSGPGEC